MIPRPFFDRPLQSDPLWWLGIVGGLIIGVSYGLREDLGPGEFAFQLLFGTFFFTMWVAGLLLSTIRHQVRRRRGTTKPEDHASST